MFDEAVVFFTDVADNGISLLTRKGSEVVQRGRDDGPIPLELWNNNDVSQAKSLIEDDVVHFIMELSPAVLLSASGFNLGAKITDDDLEESVVFPVEPLRAFVRIDVHDQVTTIDEDTCAALLSHVPRSSSSGLKCSVQRAIPSVSASSMTS
ncbi:unnamed protein product [Haemonchus placei]|uniref:VOC domain-containing protein n=1 Tax=Haemonchus placei TaxID=6290 RepID=A0A0N4WFD9_HAEPC|nr:unnamed protein product [Haemonchus placei]